MVPLGHRGPYLTSTGMSQLGGPRICLLTPSASQICPPDCFREPGGSLERVPEHRAEEAFVAVGHESPFMCRDFAGKGSVPAPTASPTQQRRCLMILSDTGLLLPERIAPGCFLDLAPLSGTL